MDCIVEEVDLRMWYMCLVENFVVVMGYYVKEKLMVEWFVDIFLLFWNVIICMKGGNLNNCFILGC